MPAPEGGAAAIETFGALLRLWSTRPHVLPEETRRHLKAGLRENLIAARTVFPFAPIVCQAVHAVRAVNHSE